jgi:hypothetical protein
MFLIHMHAIKCGVWGVECGVWGVGCGVWCGVWGVGCRVWGVGCGVVGCGVWPVWGVDRGVWHCVVFATVWCVVYHCATVYCVVCGPVWCVPLCWCGVLLLVFWSVGRCRGGADGEWGVTSTSPR